MDLSKISKGGQIWAAAGIVYFIASFLTWYSADVNGISVPGATANAWGDIGFLWGSLWALVFIAGVVLLALPAFGVAAPKLPGIAFLGAAALATLFTLLKLIIGESDGGVAGYAVHVNASFGIYLAVIAAAGAAFGGFLMFKESGGSLDDLKDINKIKSSFGGHGGSTPPPPPGMTPPPPPSGMAPPPPPPPAG